MKQAKKTFFPTWGLAWTALLGSLLGLLGSGTAAGQTTAAVLRKDLKKDFGAVGDGRVNDHAAFQRAAAFFNQRATTPAGAGAAVLTISKGTYLVGQQGADGKGADLLRLVNCRNLSIQGADSATTVIRYADGLRYGAFDPATQKPYEAPSAYFVDTNYAAGLGSFLVLQGCDKVEVANLAVNGNSSKLRVGGHWGDTGIQIAADGVFITGSRHIALRRLALHHFGRDGVQVLNHLATSVNSPAQEDILLENSTFNYNGRQGLSLTDVNGFRAVNCSFSHTGRVQVPALGRALMSAPAAGVDLEPQDGVVINVRLENCRFVDNAGQGIVADRPDAGRPATTKNIAVVGGLIWGTTNWSAWVSQPGFLFQNCRIYGAFVKGAQANSAQEATRFVGCTFEDKAYRGQPAYGPFELHSDATATRLSFTDCRFIGTHNYLLQAVPLRKDTASVFHFRNCSFQLDYAHPPQGSLDKLMGADFRGANSFRDGPHRTSLHRSDFLLGDANASVSLVLHAPGSLEFAARNSYYLVEGNFDIGRQPARTRDSALVVIGADNTVVLNPTWNQPVHELYIGPTSRLLVKKGGSLELLRNTKITIAGQLVVEDGAYFFRDPLAKLALVGRGQLRVGAKAIKTKHPKLYSNYY